MSEWRESTLGEVAQISIGKTPLRNDPRYWTSDLANPFCTIADMTTRYVEPTREGVTGLALAEGKAKRFPAGSLMMSFKLSIGRVGFAARDIFPNEAIALFEPDEQILIKEFLALALEGQDLSKGSGRAVMGSTLNRKSLRAIPVPLPPLNEQRRIVDVVAAVDAQIEALASEAEAAWNAYLNATGVLWGDESGREAELLPLGNVMALDVLRVALDPSSKYRLAGVLNAGKGLVDKGSFLGSETDYTAMNRLSTNQVVMRKLTAWEGPIAVISEYFEGFVASNEFPTFSLGEQMSPGWFAHVCRTPRLWDEMRLRVTGSVQRRKRLNPEQLLSVALPIPPLEQQRQSAKALDALLEAREGAKLEAASLQAFRATLLTALLSQSLSIPESYFLLLAADPSAREGALT